MTLRMHAKSRKPQAYLAAAAIPGVPCPGTAFQLVNPSDRRHFLEAPGS